LEEKFKETLSSIEAKNLYFQLILIGGFIVTTFVEKITLFLMPDLDMTQFSNELY